MNLKPLLKKSEIFLNQPIALKESKLLKNTIMAGFGLAALAIVLWGKVWGGVGICGLLLLFRSQKISMGRYFIGKKKSVSTIAAITENMFRLGFSDGSRSFARLIRVFVSQYCIILHFTEITHQRTFPVIILPDSVHPTEFKALKRLLWPV